MGTCCNSYRANPCSKDPVRGHSFEWRGPWKEGSYYYNDDYVTDFVSYQNVILACKRNHLSDANLEPQLIYEGDTPVDVDSQYWSFVLCSVSGNDWGDLKFNIDGDTLSYSVDGGETWIEIGQISISVIDNLSSTATDQALSANQGRILDEKITGVSNRVSAIEGNYISTETDPVFIASPAAGISASDITNWNNKTSNVGTVTSVKMNNTTKNPDGSGVVDLGTVITSETQSDWNASSGAAAILNKPTIPAAVTESTVSGWGFTKNVGTVTGVKVNNTTYNPTSGVVDLGTIGGGGASQLNDLSDVTLSSPSTGQVLSYDGSKWANAAVGTLNYEKLTSAQYVSRQSAGTLSSSVLYIIVD